MILDSSGHTELNQTAQEAVATIVEQVTTAGKWVFVNGNPFMPKDINDPVEQKILENMFYERENPEYQLTGTLKGGAVKALPRTKAATQAKAVAIAAKVLTTPVAVKATKAAVTAPAKKAKAKNTLVFRSQVLKGPVSSMFNTKNRPQMVVIFKTNSGKEYLDVVTTNYKGSRAKLAKHKDQILDSMRAALTIAE